MGLVWMLIGVVVGAVIAWLAVRRASEAPVAALNSKLAQAVAERDALAERLRMAERASGEAREQRLRDVGVLNEQIARLKTQLAAERESATDKLNAFNEARDALVAVAKESAGTAAAESGTRLLQAFEEKFRSRSRGSRPHSRRSRESGARRRSH